MNKEVLTNSGVERAVLAALCQYGDEIYVELKDIISTDSFLNETNQILYGCIEDILNANKKIEYITILESADKLGVYELISKDSEMKFIRSLFKMPLAKENVPKFVTKLAKLKLARDMKKTLEQCESKINNLTGDEDISEIIGIIENPVMELTNEAYREHSNNTTVVGENIDEYIQYLADNQSDYLGIPSGMDRFDEATGGGFRRKSISLIAARTGVGKSVIATNVALSVTMKYNIPVLYLDTEMDIADQRNRMLANLSGVEINQISKGKFARSIMEKSRVIDAATKLKNIPYHYISIAGQPFDNILNIAKRWIHQHVGFDENGRTKDCLIIYDYFKLMSSAGLSAAMQEYQALGFQITKMHDFCVKYDVPCLSFVQLNRENEVAQSDRLLWLATTVAKFEAKGEEEVADDGEMNGNRKFTIIKARHGSGLEYGDYINVRMGGKYAKLKELHTRNELKSGVVNADDEESESVFETESESESDIFDM
jgi:replicative DNA helicase